MAVTRDFSRDELLRHLETVKDPELPFLDVVELGVVRDVRVRSRSAVEVDIAPTYLGCPAIEQIKEDVRAALLRLGFETVEAGLVYSPPWTSAALSASAREKLKEAGITPPWEASDEPPAGFVPYSALQGQRGNRPIPCPRCSSTDTERLSEHGGTLCKAIYRCLTCLEPFEYFKAS